MMAFTKKQKLFGFFVAISLPFIFFLIRGFYSNEVQKYFPSSEKSHIELTEKNTPYLLNQILKYYEEKGLKFKSKSDFYDYYLDHKAEIESKFSKIYWSYKSLFEKNESKKFNFTVDFSGDEIDLRSNRLVRYQPTEPLTKTKKKLDFKVLISTNFGLSTYLINMSGEVEKAFRSSAPYFGSILFKDFFILGGSSGKIEIMEKETYNSHKSIDGYLVKGIFKSDRNDACYLSMSKLENPNKNYIYSINPNMGTLRLLNAELSGDFRAGTAFDDFLVMPDTRNRRVVALDLSKGNISHEVTGFDYPLSAKLTSRDTFLVANGQTDRVLEVDFKSEKILRSTPMGELSSPSSAIEIYKGDYKGYWLIADRDHDRVILVHPETWDIVFECANLNGPVSAEPIF